MSQGLRGVAPWAQTHMWTLGPRGVCFQRFGRQHGRARPPEGRFFGLWQCSFRFALQWFFPARAISVSPLLACLTVSVRFAVYQEYSTLLVHSKPASGSLEALQHLWAASCYNQWRKNAKLPKNQSERMKREMVCGHHLQSFSLISVFLAICGSLYQLARPFCTAADYFVLSWIFFYTHAHQLFCSLIVRCLFSWLPLLLSVLTPALCFDLVWIGSDTVTMTTTMAGFTARH